MLLNRAQRLVTDVVPPMTIEQKKRIVQTGLTAIAEAGYVSGHHAGVYSDYFPAYQALADEGALPVRVEVMLAARPENAELLNAWIETGPTRDPYEMLQVRGAKAYYDASLGSRGAKLIEDYSDMPGHSGVSGSEYGFPEALVERRSLPGFQTGIHAFGDAGNREVLDFYERVGSDDPNLAELKPRIEHAQVVHPDDLPRFRSPKHRGVDGTLPCRRRQSLGPKIAWDQSYQGGLRVAHTPTARCRTHIQFRSQRDRLRHLLRLTLRGHQDRP